MKPSEYGSTWLRTALCLVAMTGLWVGAASAQAGQVRGRVTDQNNAPLGDVQVYLSGASLPNGGSMGGLSRTTGTYVIVNVPAGSYELKAERIGMTAVTKQVTVPAGQAVEVNFELTTAALGLDEIVVTGTAGAARRREVGNQVSQINTADLPDRPTSVSDMLAAMAPGLEVARMGGGETGNGSQITLRGSNDIGGAGNNPIIFIDGVRMMSSNLPRTSAPDNSNRSAWNQPSPLDQLNPNDIERVEVISGPAASTLYGTEASGGVIQVFTKKGTSRAPSWTLEIQEGTLWNQRFGAGDEVITYPNGMTASSKYVYMDPYICTAPFKCGEYQSTPLQQDYNLAVRGGGQTLQYFTSAQHTAEHGSTPQDDLSRWNVRGNFTYSPMSDLVVQWNSGYSSTWQQNTATANNASGLTLNVFRQNQNYFGTGDPATVSKTLDWELVQQIERSTSGVTVNYTPLTNLTNRLTVGYDATQQESRSMRPFGYIDYPQGALLVTEYTRRYLSFDYVGTYSFQLAQSLTSSFSWGGQATGDFSAQVQAYGEGYPGSALPTVNSASSTLGYETRSKVWNSGFFAQNLFSLQDKYFVTLGLRVDGNSTFGKNFGLQFYPKASASWVLSDEDFWKESFGEMKLRAAYGLSGRAPNALIAQRTWINTALAGSPAFTPQNLGNPDIGPEVTSEIELGFDAAWFNDRVRPRFTYYKQHTTDAIQSVSSIPSLGFTSSVNFNLGEVENFGKEIALDVTAIRNSKLGLDVGMTFAKNGNKVLASGLDGVNSSLVGRPIGGGLTFSMWQNEEGMGSSRRSDGQYSVQSCDITLTDADGNETVVPRPALDPTLQACTFSSVNVYGYPISRPSLLIGSNMSLRLPGGISFSARGDYSGGKGYWKSTNPIAITRAVRSGICLPYYINKEDVQLRLDTPAIWVSRCNSAIGNSYNHNGETFQLRTVSMTVPMNFAFPDRVSSASMTVVLQNGLSWGHGLFGNFGINQGSSLERVPGSTSLRASLRVVF
jgi:TonB-dependent starch-binding outer membrane protein SusC